MVYTPEEKKKMDSAVQAFKEYTADNTEFDIAYSDKTGYVRLIIDEHADSFFFTLSSFEDMIDMFCMEIVSDEVDVQLKKNPSLNNWSVDYDMIRLRLQTYIDRMEEAYRLQAEKVVNKYILKRASSPHLP